MDLNFFLNNNILESSKLFFKNILDITISPAPKSEIILPDFIKEQLTDATLLNKVSDARIVGLINSLSIEGKENTTSCILLSILTTQYY